MPNKNITILSWNVNGLRAMLKKGFLDWMQKSGGDIVCLQETKISSPDQLPHDVEHPDGYSVCWNCATEKKGYSGVVIFSKIEPKSYITEFNYPILNKEGRIIGADYEDFILFNVYFPNGGMGPERLQYKIDFYDAFLKMIESYKKKGKKVIFCGDVNTAHQEIDLARPKANEKNTGFLPMERAWIDKVIKSGYIDTFRKFNNKPNQYSYWDMKSRARDRNVGWRIDYFFADAQLEPKLKNALILPDVQGSDHCPVGLILDHAY
ncbi:MAG: exodeoxyribonuclease III [Patescibacteria group bacterium]|nr:exodeoxyribonuclease III [Patescibacteria group bacterium]